MKFFGILALISSLMVACATSPHKAKLLDEDIQYRTKASNGVEVGLKDDDMVAQTKVYLSEELRSAETTSYELEAKVYGGHRYLDNEGLYGVLRGCYLAHGKTTGDLIPMSEDRSYVIPDEEYEFGIDRGHNLIGLRTEYLRDRLARFKHYKQVLLKRQTEYENKIDLCKIKVSTNEKH
ncbi:hypothetical protein DOM22_01200 [Bdellovibrio sp. ZAP7]|uniref:hypothetical protein n=1 Tax=Bdellovibrio sp. ZAP7 TaxID=2231053 RepID=UPI001157334C|nr:hypothetical protein [Bdellovibrio sp. ZAP7]QDK43875.1 hypothetical protein DOM22_01200 [Bdellovibrio sp. ZAP7]